MCKFVSASDANIEEHLATILKSLKMNDISIKRRALDLLYLMCTQNSANRIVEELLSYTEEWADLQIKEELVLKIAILSERYADNLAWYIDVVVRLVLSSGDFVTEDVWYRILQMITGFGREANPQLQRYAAQKLFTALSVPHVHETLIMIGAFVISEYS
jgi:AP-2 complex subunit alpha